MVHRSVERFDSVARAWSPVAGMSICRRYAGISLSWLKYLFRILNAFNGFFFERCRDARRVTLRCRR